MALRVPIARKRSKAKQTECWERRYVVGSRENKYTKIKLYNINGHGLIRPFALARLDIYVDGRAEDRATHERTRVIDPVAVVTETAPSRRETNV